MLACPGPQTTPSPVSGCLGPAGSRPGQQVEALGAGVCFLLPGFRRQLRQPNQPCLPGSRIPDILPRLERGWPCGRKPWHLGLDRATPRLPGAGLAGHSGFLSICSSPHWAGLRLTQDSAFREGGSGGRPVVQELSNLRLSESPGGSGGGVKNARSRLHAPILEGPRALNF